MHISPPGEIERKFITEYSRVRSRLLAPPARIRPNEPMPEPDVCSEPLAENVCDATPAIEPANEPSIALPWLPEVKRDLPAEARLTCRFIFEHVAAFYRVAMVDLASQRRDARIVRPRHVGMYLCRYLTTRSYPEIGRAAGDRDHTSVLHAVRRIEEQRQTSEALVAEITELSRRIEAGAPVIVTKIERLPQVTPRLSRRLAPFTPKPQFWDERRTAEFIRLWNEGMSSDDLSERFGRDRTAINKRGRMLGLPPRVGGRRKKA
jgi:hypothetical protein